MGPMFLDQFLISRNPGLAAIGYPICGCWVTEAHIDVRVVRNLVELVRGVVGDEYQSELCGIVH